LLLRIAGDLRGLQNSNLGRRREAGEALLSVLHAVAVNGERRVEQRLQQQAVELREREPGGVEARLVASELKQRGKGGTGLAEPRCELLTDAGVVGRLGQRREEGLREAGVMLPSFLNDDAFEVDRRSPSIRSISASHRSSPSMTAAVTSSSFDPKW
jgi:hypothetical protein